MSVVQVAGSAHLRRKKRSKQECPKKGHAAPPENGKPFNFKIINPVLGTVLNDNTFGEVVIRFFS